MQIKDHAYYIDNAPFSSEDLGVLELQLRDAIYAVDVDVVRELISNGVDVNLFAWDEGTTPIGSASEDGSSEIVSLLLKAGANPNFGNSFYPLSMACSNGHLEVVKVLIDAGVDLN